MSLAAPQPKELLESISSLNKGIGTIPSNLMAGLPWNLLREDVSLPAAVLYRSRLQHNLAWMKQFMASYGVKLAPHGKTSMAPRLFAMQMEAGAWGITLATAQQTLVAYAHGVKRVLMANQLVGRQNMTIISGLLQDADVEIYCLIDSAAQVDLLGRFFSGQRRQLRVLIELGVPGGRAGVRDEAQLSGVLEALKKWPDALLLSGVEVYEGVLGTEDEIRAFAQRAVAVTRKLVSNGSFRRQPALLSGAGSAWYDVMAEEFSAAKFGAPVEIVLRPGCYLTHDVGAYERAQQRIRANNPVACTMDSGLVPALHIWAYVQSIPEPERAIITMGRRDVAFDSGLPVPALHYRPGTAAPQSAPAHWEISKLMDQHAYLRIASAEDLQVGDMIAFDICHPCLTFDKWRVVNVVDEAYNVVDLIPTYF